MRNRTELLVCCLAAALLVLLLGAASTGGSNHAKLALCSSNLRKLQVMMARYAADHDGCMPPVWHPKQPLWIFWQDYLDPNNGRNKTFCCPADFRNEHMFESVDPLVEAMRRSNGSSFGMNERMHTYLRPERKAVYAKLLRPSRLILFGDATRPMLHVVQLPGAPRHMGRYHYVTPAGVIRNLSAEDLGGFVNGKLQFKKEDWTPWE